ncbi:hypothetical protein HII17_02960 [Thalassotalea sp. M1531]|uniref:Glycosyltransferase n=1 Tax=Thalassotalea algicola TaxID=2716224 RepID=A0A7Y0Q5N5_9GAMM|nr:MJ1255/VC2487 family glycosyltransferase [Thalassotalea algicola]NMP30513.1 hypothetical protein [Thalassotalea algicola]
MKILFGIQGTGNGHISRARILAQYLNKQPVDVTYLFSGRDKAQLFDMEVFGNYWHRKGLTFTTKNGKIDYINTFRKNSFSQFIKETKSLPVNEFDLIITDYEPVTAWAGKCSNVPVIGIGHQYAFGQNTPLAGESFIAKWIMDYFAPAKTSFGLHWHPYNEYVLPPIIDTKLEKSKCKDHILVYLPFENQQQVTALLNKIPDKKFIQYSPELINDVQGNVRLRTTCHQAFKQDLTSTYAVICNSGFELISECIHLGLPVLTKPLQGQMEQHSNALALKQLNYATVIDEMNEQQLRQWLAQSINLKARPLPNVAKYIVEWIIDGNWQNRQQLSQLLWAEATSTTERF